jgi:hypothetical protein
VYRLQKIADYDSTKDRTTQIELLRLIQGEGTPTGEGIITENEIDIITEGTQNLIEE